MAVLLPKRGKVVCQSVGGLCLRPCGLLAKRLQEVVGCA